MKLSRRSYIKTLEAQTVVIHTDGASVRGIMVASYADVIVLRHAALLSDGGATTPIDGEAIVPHHRITLIQRLEATE